jgi:hypothetical protein
MRKRGRVSAAALSIVPTGNVVSIVPRPEPPLELTDEQATEWRAVVSRMPADWFPRETHGLLCGYCRHVVSLRRVSQLIAAAELNPVLDVDLYDRLLKMQEREGRALGALATRMRITQQSTIRAEQAHKPSEMRHPWEFKGK